MGKWGGWSRGHKRPPEPNPLDWSMDPNPGGTMQGERERLDAEIQAVRMIHEWEDGGRPVPWDDLLRSVAQEVGLSEADVEEAWENAGVQEEDG